jgi:hypothetical protein
VYKEFEAVNLSVNEYEEYVKIYEKKAKKTELKWGKLGIKKNKVNK